MATSNMSMAPNDLLSGLVGDSASTTLGQGNKNAEKEDPFQLAFLQQIENFGDADDLMSFWPLISSAFGSGGGSGGGNGRLWRDENGMYHGVLANGQRADGLYSVIGVMSDEELVERWPDFPVAANTPDGATGTWFNQDWVMRDGIAWQTNGRRLQYPGLSVKPESSGDRFFEQAARFVGGQINPWFGMAVNYMLDEEDRDEDEAYRRNVQGH